MMSASGGRPVLRDAACVVALVASVSCGGGSGGGSPAQPAPLTPPPASTAGTLRGLVTSLEGGAPVEGATIAFSFGTGTPTVMTAAGGAWEMSQPSSNLAAIPVEVSAPGYVTRRTFVRWAVGTRNDIAIDLIREADPFSLTYYRQLVRNLFSKPDAPPEPIRRWTRAPSFYINTQNKRTGSHILQSEIDLVVSTIRAAVPQLTGGQFQAGEIEIGPGERAPRSGFINVTFVYEPDSEFCGQAFVGSDPGEIEINYGLEGCRTSCGEFAQRTVAHEVGHAMGFFHVAEGAVMNTVWFNSDCGVTTFSAAEQYHARVAYARLPGNRDPDNDPTSAPLLGAPAAPPIRISCR